MNSRIDCMKSPKSVTTSLLFGLLLIGASPIFAATSPSGSATFTVGKPAVSAVDAPAPVLLTPDVPVPPPAMITNDVPAPPPALSAPDVPVPPPSLNVTN